MHRKILAGLAAGLLSAALAAPASAATCNISGKERKLGATYVTSLTTKGVSCSTAQRFVRSFHRCRRSNGGADGRCARLQGYRCSERRTSAPTQYDSRATCRKGSRRIVQRYTQNT